MNEQLIRYTIVFSGQSIIALIGTVIGVYFQGGIYAFFYANLISYLVFLPFFIILLFQNRFFSWHIFKEQLGYSVPLFMYSLIYMTFFSVDKFFLKSYVGFESLGIYGLLWRFGGIFQMITIALIDAWSIILYNAHKEENNNFIISKLITYYALFLATGAQASIIISTITVHYFFPIKYQFLIGYFPCFFMPLIFIEFARLFQSIFGLVLKTWYSAIISLIVIAIQMFLLQCCATFGLWGVFIANTISFLLYALISYVVSINVYPYPLINKNKMIKIMCYIPSCCGLLHFLLNKTIFPPIGLIFIMALWYLLLWVTILDNEEKNWFKSTMATLLMRPLVLKK